MLKLLSPETPILVNIIRIKNIHKNDINSEFYNVSTSNNRIFTGNYALLL